MASKRRDEIRARADAVSAQRDQQRGRVRNASDTLKFAEAALRGLSSQRAALLGGRAVTEVETEMHNAVTATARRRDDALTGREVARVAFTGAVARLEASREQEAVRAVALAAVQEGVVASFQASGLQEPQIRALLVRGVAWADQQQSILDALELSVTEVRARHESAAVRVEKHDLQRTTELDDAQARAELERVCEQHKAASEKGARLSAEIEHDNAGRARRAELEHEGEQLRAAALVWSQLDQLIGSADGKKLRSYAQGLTLEMLLAAANERLREFARRYRLERVPGEDLAIQVRDLDM